MGSALGSGPRGRGFDSRFSDQLPKNIDGGCGEVANTSGCEPDIREFDPPQPPHNSRIGLIQCYQAFLLHKWQILCLKCDILL